MSRSLPRVLLALLPALAPLAAAAQEPLRLIPQPREATALATFPLRRGLSITAPDDAADRGSVRELAAALRERGIAVVPAGTRGAVRVTLRRAGTPAARRLMERHALRFDTAMRAEGYVLVADTGGVEIIGATAAGVFYGTQTLRQLIEGDGAAARLRGARIRDWPAMRWRGLHDDLSRGPMPTLEFQKRQIRTFAAYKLNVYSPYFEHTLAYPRHPLIAPPGGAMTPEQVKELVAYARRYHVEVIPEQEAFGHLHHVLKHELYSPLGETEHGHVLAPDQPESLALIRDWFTTIDSLFPGRFIHLGADETFELGRGRTAERVRAEGIGKVYLDFLTTIDTTLRPLMPKRRFLFWGDVAMNHPDLVRSLPRDLIAVGWNYNEQKDGFARFLTPFTEAGMETWVAPGVNNWNRVYPNYAVALPNIQGFVRDGQRLGATGMLNTTWDDDGESLFNQTWYGVLFGAAASWQPGESDIAAFQSAYGRVFHGDTTRTLDEAQRLLAEAHTLLRQAGVGDASDYLYWLDPWSGEGMIVAEKIRPVARRLRVLAEGAIVDIAQARRAGAREADAMDALELGARRMDLIGMKFLFADEVVRMYARATDTTSRTSPTRDLGDITGINGRLQDLRDAYGAGRDEFERLWLRENRPYWLRNVLVRYDLAMQLWVSRADRVNLARQQWYRTRKLPSAAELGIPAEMPGLSAASPVAGGSGRP
ncbi:MAG TPA: glycoside hydrolase family 20 zincin-like fold domain-containing protein [Gemmatimonadaceae bacterium]|nr:glycoside hydrolase family 20 zincin-like fold domain-containing protein [Gemmatimonadaceae bacterium]